MPAGGRGGGALPLSDTRLPWTWTSGAEGVGDGGGIADMAIHCYENGADLLRRKRPSYHDERKQRVHGIFSVTRKLSFTATLSQSKATMLQSGEPRPESLRKKSLIKLPPQVLAAHINCEVFPAYAAYFGVSPFQRGNPSSLILKEDFQEISGPVGSGGGYTA